MEVQVETDTSNMASVTTRAGAFQCQSQPKTDASLNPSAYEQYFVLQLAQDISSKDSIAEILPSLGKGGVLIENNFKILKFLGSGAYGNVFKARDAKGYQCAIKIIKTRHKNSRSILRELTVMERINKLDPKHTQSFTVILFRALTFHQHLFFVYELLGPTVSDILTFNQGRGFPPRQVRRIGLQLCMAVNFLHKNGMIHRDIKPDNIAFTSPGFYLDPSTGQKIMDRSNIKLIDFGSTIFTATELSVKTATTRQYRAPEVEFNATLNLEESLRGDMWSVGCTLFELYIGSMLFPCSTNEEKCYVIEATLRQEIPLEMGKSSKLICFDVNGKLRYDLTEEAIKVVKAILPIDEYATRESPKLPNLWDFVKKVVIIKPADRLNSLQALRHEFWRS